MYEDIHRPDQIPAPVGYGHVLRGAFRRGVRGADEEREKSDNPYCDAIGRPRRGCEGAADAWDQGHDAFHAWFVAHRGCSHPDHAIDPWGKDDPPPKRFPRGPSYGANRRKKP